MRRLLSAAPRQPIVAEVRTLQKELPGGRDAAGNFEELSSCYVLSQSWEKLRH